jgi:hypothetical protein
MPFVAKFMIIEIWFLLIGLAVIIVSQLVTRSINIKGLLYEDNSAGKFCPARIQLLLVSVSVSIYYLMELYKDHTRFPMINKYAVLVFGVSNLVYIAVMYWSSYHTEM